MTLPRHISDRLRRGWRWPGIPGLVTDRRGITAVIFAVTATAVLGLVGLATEAGTWYVAREQAYNIAYSAAVAGALAAASNGDVQAAVTDVANAYTAGSVTANRPPSSGNYTADANATEVVVSVNFIPVLARIFTQHAITVTARAVATVETVGTACALSLIDDLTITQNQWGLNGFLCYYASNSTSPTAVNIVAGNTMPIIQTFGITTPGDCGNCPIIAHNPPYSVLTGGFDDLGNLLYRPNSSYQPPTRIDIAPSAFPSAWDFAGATGITSLYTDIDQLPWPAIASQIICPIARPGGLTYANPAASLDPGSHCPLTAGEMVTIADGGNLVSSEGDASGAGTCVPTAGQICGYSNMNVTICGGTAAASPPAPPAPGCPSPASSVSGTGSTVKLLPLTRALDGLYILDRYSRADSTYLFVNASLTVQSGAAILCTVLNPADHHYHTCSPGNQFTLGGYGSYGALGVYGVTIVMTGSQPGALTIASGAIANLSAPISNTFNHSLDGILFYRGPGNGGSALSPAVNIADTSGEMLFNGGMYFPDSYVFYTGNTNPAPEYTPECSILVAGHLTLGFFDHGDNQPNPTQFSNSCFSEVFGAPLPSVRAVRVVE